MYTNTASPWWEPPETHAANTKEAAIKLHRARTRWMKRRATHALIYTDGSEIQDQVGAAAWCPGAGRSKARYLGENTKSTVYSAELVGLELALQITQELDNCNGATIFTDNQAAIQAVTRPIISSGQYITHRVIKEMEKSRGKGINTTIQWTPSHKGTPGNEEVDLLGKKAAGWVANTGKPYSTCYLTVHLTGRSGGSTGQKGPLIVSKRYLPTHRRLPPLQS
jgi:ribonuclease HI